MTNTTKQKWFWSVILTVFALNLALVYFSLIHGIVEITPGELLKTLLRIETNPQSDLLIFEFRLPRIIAAGLVGSVLGLAGAVTQGITRNGLADPGVLGINAGAGFGIVVFIMLFQTKTPFAGPLAGLLMTIFGLAGGFGTALITFICALHKGSLDPERLILTGIAIGSGMGAAALYLSLKLSPADFQMAVIWLAGSVTNTNWQHIIMALPWLAGLIPVIVSKSNVLDIFQLEESSVRSMGVATEREKAILLLSSVGLVSVGVSIAGGIGFVGLIVPHLAKGLVGYSHHRVIPVCAGLGMLLVIGADLIGRSIMAPAEVAVGIVISIIGAPYFIYLLFRAKT